MHLTCAPHPCPWPVPRPTSLICAPDADHASDPCCVCPAAKEMLSRDQDCLLPVEEAGVLWDSVCFLFLLLQRRVFLSHYFLHVRAELQATALLASRLALPQVPRGPLGQASPLHDTDTSPGGRTEAHRPLGPFHRPECLTDDERSRPGSAVSLLPPCRPECAPRLEGLPPVAGRPGLLSRRRLFTSTFSTYETGGHSSLSPAHDKAGVVVGSWPLV